MLGEGVKNIVLDEKYIITFTLYIIYLDINILGEKNYLLVKKIIRLKSLKNNKNDTSLLLTDKISRNFIQLKAHIFFYRKLVKTLKQANYKVLLI